AVTISEGLLLRCLSSSPFSSPFQPALDRFHSPRRQAPAARRRKSRAGKHVLDTLSLRGDHRRRGGQGMSVQTIYSLGPSSLAPGQTDYWHWWFGGSWGEQTLVLDPLPLTPDSALTWGNLRRVKNSDGQTWYIDVTNNGPFAVEYKLFAVFLTV